MRIIKHATVLPQVSFSRPNFLPSPKELQASSLTVVSEARAVSSRPGGALEEDYGDEDADEEEAAEAEAERAAAEDPANFSAHLRQRPLRGRAAQRASAPPPPGVTSSAMGIGGVDSVGGGGVRAGACGGESVRGGEERAGVRRDAVRWCVVVGGMVVALCLLEPVLTCLGALVTVGLVSARHRRGAASSSPCTALPRATPSSAATSRSTPPAPISSPTTALAMPIGSPATATATTTPTGSESQRAQEKAVWEATRETWQHALKRAGAGCEDVSVQDGVNECCGGTGAGGCCSLQTPASVAQTGASSYGGGGSGCDSATCCASANLHTGDESVLHGSHPEWRAGQLT